jgi:hypothetical protein
VVDFVLLGFYNKKLHRISFSFGDENTFLFLKEKGFSSALTRLSYRPIAWLCIIRFLGKKVDNNTYTGYGPLQ